MKQHFPIPPDRSAGAVWDVLLRLKIRDAMSKKIHKASKTDTFRALQKVMKDRNVSGLPVVEEDRLIGIVSLDDILTALDKGLADDSVEKYMTRNLILLEEDMPLTFAISHFNKYRYHRYPVIDRDKKLAGMITSRDILAALVREMDKEIRELETKIHEQRPDVPNELHYEFFVKRLDFENAGRAAYEIKKVLKERNIDPAVIRRVAVAAYELEINIVIHSDGGKLVFHLDPEKASIQALDSGPGIENVELAVQEGYSTANDWVRSLGFGAGMGLTNAKRSSDEFTINSTAGGSTSVTAVIRLVQNKEG